MTLTRYVNGDDDISCTTTRHRHLYFRLFPKEKIIRAFDRSKRNLSFFVKMNVEQFEHVKFSVTRLGYFLTKIAQINAIWYTLKTALFK